MTNYIFDTNVFRRASEFASVRDGLVAFKAKQPAGSQLFVCELTLLELNSQLRRDGCRRYEQRKAALLFSRSLTDSKILPLPDYFLGSHIFKTKSIADVDQFRLAWDIYWRHLEESKSITSFKRKPSVSFDAHHRKQRISVNSWNIAKVRTEFERSYILSMALNAAPITSVGYQSHRKDPADPVWREIRELIASDDFEWLVYEALANRCAATLVGAKTPSDSANIAKLNGFMTAYRWVLNKMLESDYNYETNKNDYIDIHLLPYLAEPDFVVVTQDKRLSSRLGQSPQAGRVVDLAALGIKVPATPTP